MPLHDVLGLDVDVEGMTAQLWIFVACNVGIACAYAFLATRVVPRLPVRLPTLVGGFGFFVTCGLTHLDMAFHTLVERDTTWGAIASADHMLLIHVPQVVFVTIFAAGFFHDLRVMRAQGILGPAPTAPHQHHDHED